MIRISKLIVLFVFILANQIDAENDAPFIFENIGDTLTVIQRPIVNIPTIAVPGQTIQITALALTATTGWQAELIHDYKTLPLEVTDAAYNPDLGRWTLSVIIPVPAVYELYDLHVTADNGVDDTTWDAVRIIPEFRQNYSFAHLTDTHLVTHYYFDNPASVSDSSEVADLRAVIADINLLNPEFVLLTGDFLNEGELEDLEERRYFTRGQRLLTEFEVPVYLTSGNHDIGGWEATPAPQGTARRDWWRFFGWPWLLDPPAAAPYVTQDYSFDYGPVHFVGLESYINYDYYLEDIYGYTSFIDSQLDWLADDLENAVGSEAIVLFYHMDFDDQIDLSALGVDLALWGHIHSNSGDITQYPYNLATDNICDGDRAYRLIRVENGVLHPEPTIHAGEWDDFLHVTFDPANNGTAETVTATIINQHALPFDRARLKMIMPAGNFDYFVENGQLEQVDRTGPNPVCYIQVDIPANSQKLVTITAQPGSAIEEGLDETFPQLLQNYPNPFSHKTAIRFRVPQTSRASLKIYDINGRLVRTLVNSPVTAGAHEINWDGTNEIGRSVNAGIYHYQLATTNYTAVRRLVVYRD